MNLKNLNRSTKSNGITFGIVISFYLLIQILSAAGMVTNSFAGQLVPICAYVVMAVSLNLTVGMLGELSLGHAGFMSVGAFAAEVDSTCVEGYLPPQEQMVQGDIALHSADVAVGEKDPSYGGYGAPEGNPIQGNIMLISGDELADTTKTEARYTVKGLLGKQLLYTARQKDGVLTLDVPAEVATFRTTIEDMQALQASGVKTLVLVTEKNTTTLNLSLLCEGQKSGTRVTLRHLGSNATLSVGLRCRRDLLIGR